MTRIVGRATLSSQSEQEQEQEPEQYLCWSCSYLSLGAASEHIYTLQPARAACSVLHAAHNLHAHQDRPPHTHSHSHTHMLGRNFYTHTHTETQMWERFMFDFRMRLAVWVDLKVPQRGVCVWVERVSNGLPLDAPTAAAAAVACCTAIVVRVAVVVMRK